MIVISKYFVPKGYLGLTIFPFILLKNRKSIANSVLINHEKIHLKQQLELLVIPFFVFYLIEFLGRLAQYRNWKLAYRNISFEREAYANEKDLDYIRTRPLWNCIKYL